MIVDASALVAVALGEADADPMFAAMRDAASPCMPSPAWLEASMAVSRAPRTVALDLDHLVRILDLEIVAFTAAHAAVAAQAWAVYGRGSGHRARLNFGDCMVYAVASVEALPLLFKGDDFSHTDVVPALPV